jgi:hypothetical protein
MEYIIGSLITLLSIFVLRKSINKQYGSGMPVPRFTQSRKHELIKFSLPYLTKQIKPLVTQATKDFESRNTRILMLDGYAYWIQDSSLVSAKMNNGTFNPEEATRVDMMAIDAVQLKNMVFIVDQLTKGKNDDRSNSGD